MLARIARAPPLSSTKSLRQTWKGRADATRVSFATTPEGLGTRTSSFSRGVAPSYDGFPNGSSTDGGWRGERQESFAGVGVPQRSVDRRDDDFLRGEESKRGMEEAGGRSTQWTVGAAVAGRLEEMRARELGASLRAKVQENEAMKRYLDSVKVRAFFGGGGGGAAGRVLCKMFC